jgi:hypothetical protein
MAKKVEMSVVNVEVQRVTTSPSFHVSENGKVVGDLKASTGGVYWRPKNYQQHYHLTWEQVDAIFKEKGVAKTLGEYKITPPEPGTFEDF